MSERILVTGSREWPGTWEDIAVHLPDGGDVTIIHGACSRKARFVGTDVFDETSVDMLADFAARGLGFNVVAFPADWSLGKKAGPIRNAWMLRGGKPDRGLAFGALWRRRNDSSRRVPGYGWRTTGTGGTVSLMLAAGLPVRWVPAPGAPAQDLTAMPSPPVA